MTIDLKDLEAKSEILMYELALQDEQSLNVKLTTEQQLLNIPKYLIYIASLVIQPGRNPPYTKEEERIFARLQILYKQKKQDQDDEKKSEVSYPKLFKLSPKFFDISVNSHNDKLVGDKKNKVVVTESRGDEIRRLKIIQELLDEEVVAEKSKKQKNKKKRIDKRRVTDSNKENEGTKCSSNSSLIREEEGSYSDNPISKALLSLDGLTTEDANNSQNDTIKPSIPSENCAYKSNNNAPSNSTIITDTNKPNSNNNEMLIEANQDDTISHYLNEIISQNFQSNPINYIPITPHNNISYLAAATSNNQSIECLKKEIQTLRLENQNLKFYYEEKLKQQEMKHTHKLQESIRIEREKLDERFQALQLRLYISDNRCQTLEDALEEHLKAVSHLGKRTPRDCIGDSTL